MCVCVCVCVCVRACVRPCMFARPVHLSMSPLIRVFSIHNPAASISRALRCNGGPCPRPDLTLPSLLFSSQPIALLWRSHAPGCSCRAELERTSSAVINTHGTRDPTSLYLHLYADDHRHETGSERLLTNRILLRRTVRETGTKVSFVALYVHRNRWRIRFQCVIELFCPCGRGSKVYIHTL